MVDKQFKKVRAIFNPSKNHFDTLKGSAKPLIGKEYVFQYLWIAEGGEMFEGTWILQPMPKTEGVEDWYEAGIANVPEFDLKVIKTIKKD